MSKCNQSGANDVSLLSMQARSVGGQTNHALRLRPDSERDYTGRECRCEGGPAEPEFLKNEMKIRMGQGIRREYRRK